MSFKKLKMTRYFREAVLVKRPEFSDMENQIMEWIGHPSKIETQVDGRTRMFARDNKIGKWVRIILEKDELHNIFYDSNYKG